MKKGDIVEFNGNAYVASYWIGADYWYCYPTIKDRTRPDLRYGGQSLPADRCKVIGFYQWPSRSGN